MLWGLCGLHFSSKIRYRSALDLWYGLCEQAGHSLVFKIHEGNGQLASEEWGVCMAKSMANTVEMWQGRCQYYYFIIESQSVCSANKLRRHQSYGVLARDQERK
jgi:hypothetical protein